MKTDQQNDFYHFQNYCTAFKLRYLIDRNHDATEIYANYKVPKKFS